MSTYFVVVIKRGLHSKPLNGVLFVTKLHEFLLHRYYSVVVEVQCVLTKTEGDGRCGLMVVLVLFKVAKYL